MAMTDLVYADLSGIDSYSYDSSNMLISAVRRQSLHI